MCVPLTATYLLLWMLKREKRKFFPDTQKHCTVSCAYCVIINYLKVTLEDKSRAMSFDLLLPHHSGTLCIVTIIPCLLILSLGAVVVSRARDNKEMLWSKKTSHEIVPYFDRVYVQHLRQSLIICAMFVLRNISDMWAELQYCRSYFCVNSTQIRRLKHNLINRWCELSLMSEWPILGWNVWLQSRTCEVRFLIAVKVIIFYN